MCSDVRYGGGGSSSDFLSANRLICLNCTMSIFVIAHGSFIFKCVLMYASWMSDTNLCSILPLGSCASQLAEAGCELPRVPFRFLQFSIPFDMSGYIFTHGIFVSESTQMLMEQFTKSFFHCLDLDAISW